MTDLLLLPVSVGEALDKLSILDIKVENITDNRYEHVKKEHDLLQNKLQNYIQKTQKYYNMIKKTNKHIWDLMDLLRDGENIDDGTYLRLSKETIYANDVRFRIKNKINNISKSSLKEQKSYKVLKTLFDLTCFKGDIKMLTNTIYYFSIMCDELYIKTSSKDHISFIDDEFEGQIFIMNNENSVDLDTHCFKEIYDFTNVNTENDIYGVINVSKSNIDMYV
jgi:hypothetical protein